MGNVHKVREQKTTNVNCNHQTIISGCFHPLVNTLNTQRFMADSQSVSMIITITEILNGKTFSLLKNIICTTYAKHFMGAKPINSGAVVTVAESDDTNRYKQTYSAHT